jgi:hypothetical protein
MKFGVGAADVVCVEGKRIGQFAALRPPEAELPDKWREHR